MFNKKLNKYICFALVILFAFTSCKSNVEKKIESKKNILTILDSVGIEPLKAEAHLSTAAFSLYEAIYEPLVKYGYKGEILPALAEKWEISNDGKKYTFYLRKDVKFSDREKFNADSVVLASKKWDPNSFSAKMKSIKKISDYIVEIEFEENSYPCLTEFTYPRPYRISSPKSYNKKGKFKGMIGTGQWMIQEYKNKEVVLVNNPYYYGKKPKIKKIILKEVPNPQSRLMALQNEEADISIAQIPLENYDILKNNKNLNVLEKEGTMGFFLIMNYENPIFKDENIRKALNFAVNKDSIVKNILNNQGIVAKGILPNTVPYVNDKNSKGYNYNINEAKKLLKKSGFDENKRLNLRLVFQTEEYSSWKPICEYLKSEYSKIGIDLKLIQLGSAAYYDSIWENRNFDLIIYRTYEDSWNPHGFLRSMFYQEGSNKSVCFYDKNLNQNLKEVISTIDEKKRQEKYDEIFKLIESKALTVPIYYPKTQYIYNKRLKGLKIAPTSYEAIELDQVYK